MTNYYPEDLSNVPPLPADIERLTSSEINRYIIQYQNGKNKLLEEIEILSVGMNDLIGKRDTLEVEVRKLAEALKSIKDKLLEEKSYLHQHRRDESTYDERIRALSRYMDLAMRRETANRRLKDLSRQYDMVTHDLLWRQHAMKHQIDGAKHMAATEMAVLADEMGLGKTLTILATIDMVKADKIIVISSKAVLGNFHREIRKWAPHRKIVNFVEKKKGVRKAYIEALQDTRRGWITLVNFEAWRRDKELIPDLISLGAKAVIIDEAHALKDPTSQTFKGVRDLCHTPNYCERCEKTTIDYPNGLFKSENYGDGVKRWVCNFCQASYTQWYKGIRSVKYIYPMTGTVILNKPQEMWSLLHLIDPENFPKLDAFTRDYCIQASWYDHISGKTKYYWKWTYGGLDRLLQRIPHHILKRTKKQLVEAGIMEALPPQEIQYHNLEWSEEYVEQYKAYQGIKQFFQVLMTNDAEDISAVQIQFALMRLRQVVVWPGSIVLEEKDKETGAVLYRFQCKVEKSQKLDYAEDLIRQLVNEGQRVVLFSKFTPPLQELHRRFINNPIIEGDDERISSAVMDGDTPTYKRDQMTADFDRSQERDDVPRKWNVLLANYGVGGVSLTLTGATQLIILDREWNPGKEDQALARINRIGQTENTTVHILQMERTVDVFMDSLIKIKSGVVDGLEQTITDAEIRDALIKALTEE